MTNVKCIRCGVVNLVSNEVCKVCDAELTVAPTIPPSPYHILRQPGPIPSGQPAIAGIGRFDGVGDVLGPTFTMFFKNIWLITKIVVVIAAPFEIFRTLSVPEFRHDWQLAFGTFALQILCKILIAPALIYAVVKVGQTGEAPGVNESYRWGLGKIGKLSLCAALTGTLEVLGALLLIIPGIILALAFTVVYPVALLEKHSVTETLRRSYRLTNGRKWNLLGASILLAIAFGIISIPITAVSSFLLLGGVDFWPARALIFLVVDILNQSTTIFSLVVYLSILRTLE
jgi:hypothetical protein